MPAEQQKKKEKDEADYQRVAACLNDSETVQLIIGENKYNGEIEQWKLGEAIVYKVANLDQEIVYIPEGFSGAIIKAFGKKGHIRNYETKIIKKKLPRVLLSFPAKEVERVQREHARLYANISTPLILEKREHDMLPDDRTGMGTIDNVSQGGCSIVTHMPLKPEDTVNFYLPVKSESGSKDLDLYGKVMNVEKLDNGQIRTGMKYIRLGIDNEKEISDYMSRRLDAAQAII